MRILFPAFICCLATGQAAYSAEWKVEPNLRFSAGYNDNLRLSSTSDKTSTGEATFAPSAVFSVATPTSGANGTLRFDFRRFEADSSLNDNNVRFTSNIFHNLEQSRLSLNLGVVNDTTLDSQLDTTGIALNRINRQSLSARPEWSHSFNARSSMSMNYSYRNIQYENAKNSGLTDSTVNGASISLNHALNERSQASITLSGTQSDNDNNVESTNLNLQGGASYQLSDTWTASLFMGIRRTEVNFSRNSSIFVFSPIDNTIIASFPLTRDVSNKTRGLTFNASIKKTWLRGDIAFSAAQAINNDISGQPIVTTSFRPTAHYRFSETLSGALNLQYSTSKADTNLSSSLDQASFQVTSSLNWNVTNFWSLSGSYRYRKQTFDNLSDDAVQNIVSLALTYKWPRISVSR